MKRYLIILIVFILPGIACRALQEKEAPPKAEIAAQPADKKVDKNTNIHYTGKFCSECHIQNPVAGGPKYLKFNRDYNQLCWCHDDLSKSYHHPSDIRPTPTIGPAKGAAIDFPLEEGKITCNTCHNIYLQCRKQLFIKTSLRGAPYPKRTDFCYHCHDEKLYVKLNPHVQLDSDNHIIEKKCLFCHLEKPDEKTATYKDAKFIGNMEILCQRCHMISGNHSGNVDHLAIRPSGKGLERIKAMEKKFDLILPLDETGKMTCITCHNPHQKGVIPPDKPSAKGADSKFRHRLPGRLCQECHQK